MGDKSPKQKNRNKAQKSSQDKAAELKAKNKQAKPAATPGAKKN